MFLCTGVWVLDDQGAAFIGSEMVGLGEKEHLVSLIVIRHIVSIRWNSNLAFC